MKSEKQARSILFEQLNIITDQKKGWCYFFMVFVGVIDVLALLKGLVQTSLIEPKIGVFCFRDRGAFLFWGG